MVDRYKVLRSCVCKKAYVTETMALRAAESVMRNHKIPEGYTEVAYKCNMCNWFHVGRKRIELPPVATTVPIPA